ncbi:MAG: winged helix-turn-helix transcriptional regulator [Hyphomicrobiales bacterium]
MSDVFEDLKLPRLGEAVAGSTTGQPIMVLFDLIGRRWSMGVLWNLRDGSRTFRQLQTKCGSASPTVLNTRLKELRAVGLVEKTVGGYALTQTGRELFNLLQPLGDWANDWTKQLS